MDCSIELGMLKGTVDTMSDRFDSVEARLLNVEHSTARIQTKLETVETNQQEILSILKEDKIIREINRQSISRLENYITVMGSDHEEKIAQLLASTSDRIAIRESACGDKFTEIEKTVNTLAPVASIINEMMPMIRKIVAGAVLILLTWGVLLLIGINQQLSPLLKLLK